ncbi:MAG: hypothetical protein OT477_13020 [Chloroflexi bacterium]|nr:hypothetical protein [Chloroflexota bacterium]
MSQMTPIQQLNLLEEGNALLAQAVAKLQEYVQASQDKVFEECVVELLQDLAGQGNPYSENVPAEIERVKAQLAKGA